jgi:hypothetical protein
MQVVPFGPSPSGQKHMAHPIFGPDKGTAFKKIAAGGGLKMIHLTPIICLDDFAVVKCGQQVC